MRLLGYHANLLDLFLTYYTEKCSAEMLPLLSFPDILLVSVKEAKPKAFFDMSFHRTIFRSNKVDWDSFKSYMVEASLSGFLKYRAYRTATIISEWIIFGVECVYPIIIIRKYQTGSLQKVLQTYYYNIYPRKWCSTAFAEFKTTHSHWKKDLENEMCGYLQVVQTKVESKRHVPVSSGKYLSKFSIYAYY